MTTATRTLARTARRAGSLLSWMLLLAGLVSLAGAMWWVTNAKTDPRADIASFRPYVVATGSMAPEYDVNAFVLTRATPFDEVREGDVVSFRAAAIGGRTTLHRVVDIQDANGEPVAFVVKGDNNPEPDSALVTRDEYLGTAVAHTNATAFLVQQYQAPYGLLRVVIVPTLVLMLLWVAVRALGDRQRTVLGKTAVFLLVATCFLASVIGSYGLYLHQKEARVVATLDGYAARFESTAAPVSLTLAGTTVNGTIDIPSIDVHYPVVDYVAASSLNIAVTHFSGPGLNQAGNVALAGHRAWGNLYFTRIDHLKRGDTIWVTDSNRQRVRYVVTRQRVVTPDDTSVLRQPSDGKRHLTLIACTYDLRNRYIVSAVESGDEAASARKGSQAMTVADAGDGASQPEATDVAHPAPDGVWPRGAFPVALGLTALALAGLAAGAVRWGLRRGPSTSSAAPKPPATCTPEPNG